MSIVDQIKSAAILGLAKNPVAITGTLGAGNVLTASLRTGFSATGFQWTRNGSDISGQTASTYTQLTSDRGAVIGCRAIGLSYAGTGGTVPVVAPGAPTGVSASAGNGSVTATFTAPADNGGSAITGYQMPVYRASDNLLLGTATGSGSPLTLNGLPNGVAVYVTVAAVNAIGVGTPSAASSSVIPAQYYPFKTRGQSLPSGSLFTTTAVSAGYSYKTVQSVPVGYTRVRAILRNASTTATATAKAAFSPSESLANGSTPTIGGAASHASTQPFLFGGSDTVTLPVASAAGVPSLTVSDWLNVNSLARTDASDGTALAYAVRYLGNSTGVGYSQLGNGVGPYIEGLAGSKHRVRVYEYPVDAVANPAGFPTTTSQGSNWVPIELEFDYVVPVRSVVQAGDSTKVGQGNTVFAGPIWLAAAQLDALNKIVSVSSIAQQGRTAANTLAQVQAIMANTVIDTLYFQPFSVNDTSNYSGSSSAAMARVDTIIAACAAAGTNLILETPLPIVAAGGTAVSGSELTALNTMHDYIMSKASNVVKVLDMAGLHDPAKPGVWSATYGYDNYHPNPNGYVYQGNQLFAALQALF